MPKPCCAVAKSMVHHGRSNSNNFSRAYGELLQSTSPRIRLKLHRLGGGRYYDPWWPADPDSLKGPVACRHPKTLDACFWQVVYDAVAMLCASTIRLTRLREKIALFA